ncbi:uncharacterized protein LOC106404016 [Brassica napus]|uniref:uncharacterized protein LOC106404016 n=1 Tax=Brassica napus TaxID=3708 RepID=UPI0006AB5DDA|nr:uncharacterized protein LOC106404016 [Brassica napus]
MTVSSLIDPDLKVWDARLLEQFVAQEDISMIQSLAISPIHRRDTFCWSYTKNGQYPVKSGYWVATNLMRDEEDIEVLQPSITKLQAFAWKVAVTRNLNSIVVPEDDRDSYPWIIWYIWKARNDKLFRGTGRDPLELVRYAESECQAWYNARDTVSVPTQVQIAEETQALRLDNIYMVDGSWTSTAQFSGMGWVWKDTMGKIQLMGSRNLRRRDTALHSKLGALQWAMESMIQNSTCQRFGIDCKDLIAISATFQECIMRLKIR